MRSFAAMLLLRALLVVMFPVYLALMVALTTLLVPFVLGMVMFDGDGGALAAFVQELRRAIAADRGWWAAKWRWTGEIGRMR